MLFLGLSVPGEVPKCSASVLVLLAGFLNSGSNKNSTYINYQVLVLFSECSRISAILLCYLRLQSCKLVALSCEQMTH